MLNIAIVRLKETLPPELLVVYLNTNYGRGYLWYLSRQTEQVNLNCREVEKLLVPPFGEVFQVKHHWSAGTNGSSMGNHPYTVPLEVNSKSIVILVLLSKSSIMGYLKKDKQIVVSMR